MSKLRSVLEEMRDDAAYQCLCEVEQADAQHETVERWGTVASPVHRARADLHAAYATALGHALNEHAE